MSCLFFWFRTPFFRSTKITRTSNRTDNDLEDAVGLNELEGAVLLDAEDYRRMLQEVKTLKSVLLRLKRELAADVRNILLVIIQYEIIYP